MPTIDTTGAGARMLARRVNTPAHCLEYVWDAISQGKYHYITGGAASAYATWLAIPESHRHNGDRHPPKDMPVFFGIRTSTGNVLGDVIISNGDPIPYTFATDYPTSGKIGTPTLQQRAVQVGRVYLGWADSMGGYTLTSSSWSGGGITPIDPTNPTNPTNPTGSEEPMIIKSLSNSNYTVAGTYYLNDVGGHWRGLTNLEQIAVDANIAAGKIPFAQYAGSDIDLLFGLSGLWEQAPIPANTKSSAGVAVTGPGSLTGRLGYPGYRSYFYPATEGVPTGGNGGSTDLSPVLDAIGALDKQADSYQTALLGELGGVPDATLQAFGLQRIPTK